MTSKSAFIIVALALASFNIAGAKTYDIKLDHVTKVGNTDLKAGEYKVKVEGSQAVFTDAESVKSFTAPVKIENNDRKIDQTMVRTLNQNGTESLREIDLGGAATKLEFGE